MREDLLPPVCLHIARLFVCLVFLSFLPFFLQKKAKRRRRRRRTDRQAREGGGERATSLGD